MVSVCGSVSSTNNKYQVTPHGLVCCANCRSIIFARESWAREYNYTF